MSIALDTRGILESLRPRREAVRHRLAAVRRRVRARLLLTGLAWTWGAVFLFAAVSLAADWLLRLSLPARLALDAAGGLVIAIVAYRRLISPLVFHLDDLDLAAVIDRRCPGVGQRVASVLQLPSLLEGRVLASPSMVRAAVVEHAQALDQADLWSAFDRGRHRRAWLLLLITAAATAGFIYALPQVSALWARRWLMGSHERWPQRNYLAITGLDDEGRLLAPRGESVTIDVDAAPQFIPGKHGWLLFGRGEPLLVRSENQPAGQPPESVSIRYRSDDGVLDRQGNFTHFSGGDFRYEIPQIAEPLDVSIAGGDDWFGPVRIEPIDRPTVESLTVIARPPGQDKPQTHTADSADSQLLFLPDTELELRLTSSVPLDEARLLAKEGAPPKLVRDDDTHYSAKWTMREAQTLQLSLVGKVGRLESKPYYLSIGLLIDRAPRVTVRSSGVGRRVTPQARIPLTIHAADDFGIASLSVELESAKLGEEKPETKEHKLPLELPPSTAEAPVTEYETKPQVKLADYALPAGTMVKLRGLAIDACAQGAQTGASRLLAFQVVTPEELFYEILTRQRAERAKFAAALETAKSQTEPLAGVPSSDAAYGLVKKHQVIARQVWQVAKQLDGTLEEMSLNELGSPQARELLKTKVIDAIRQLHGDPMVRLRADLERVAADPEGSVEALESARGLQQEVLDQMAKILEQMSQWENFIDVLNQLKQIIKLENGVLEATEQEKKTRTQDIFDE